jgi:hypothetical protein
MKMIRRAVDWSGGRVGRFLYRDVAVCYKKERGSMEDEMEKAEVAQENRKIRYLRFLVDFSILSIQQDALSRGEAEKLVEDVKKAACNLFPGKEETFELIYRPRFHRVIEERFGPFLNMES